ncbi:hypothetical protein [Paenibacillus odorifer]|uniref:hypothetical protein n=1 Tax=Paenibacillus odorifer TaxID=189426 RepID=UPI00096F41ED|nr:hypothetical protein [Paenibacillus odorifer]OMD76901.1 hypothetical protein BSK50_14210 [Paenibacillus odorifer]
MLYKLIEKLFPETFNSIRLKGYGKGYSEGFSVGFNDGKIKGYKDGLSRNGENVLYIDSYGMTILNDKNCILVTQKE